MKTQFYHAACGLLYSLIVLVGCSHKEILPPEKDDPTPTKAEVTALTVTPAECTLKPGESIQLQVAVTPKEATGAALEWRSLGLLYAKVDDNGLVTALQEGSARIRVSTADKMVSTTCTITISAAGEPGPDTPDNPDKPDTPDHPDPGPTPTYRVWEDTGASLPDYPTYNTVSALADFPRIDITWEKETQRLAEGEYTWVDGTVRFRDPKGMYKTATAESYETDSQVLKMKIRGRGNTSYDAEGGIKHSYKIKLDEHRKVFGMKGDKDWILLADVQDPSLLRNAVALRIARMVSMPWTPKYRAAEVYFNGQYGGCYLLVEAKEVDRENKVPITVVEAGQTDGGYLLEIDNKQDYDRYFRTETFQKKIKFKEPEFGDRNNPDNSADAQAQMNFITDYVNEVERLLAARSFDPETGYQSKLDLYTFIGNYIVQELTMNVDGGMRLSTYFAKDKDTKLFMPMVWDFDLSLGNCSYLESDFNLEPGMGGPKGWFIKIRGGSFENGDRDGSRKSYYQYLFEDPLFVQALKDRWNLVKPRLDKIPAFIDQMTTYNKLAYDHNVQAGKNPRAKRWTYYPPDNFTSWSEAVQYMKDFYTERLAWLDENINAL
ncbi:MAG: CotH kinase family protein [Bacteroidales bacterium]|nr:CotH kinase family protein [Bacteroidales bacterium]